MKQNLLQLNPDKPLSGHRNTMIVSCILGGNNVYNSCILHGRRFGILGARPFVALANNLMYVLPEKNDGDDISALSHQLTS